MRRDSRERRDRDDEAVDQHGNAALGGGDDRAADRCDLEPADGAKDVLGGRVREPVLRERGVDDSALRVRPVASRPVPSPVKLSALRFKQRRRDRGRRRGVADSHLAENDEIGLGSGSARDRALAAVEGESEIGGTERGLLAEVATATARLVGDDAGHRCVRKRAGIDDFERRAEFARQHRNRGASGGEIRHHRDRHLLRIGGDTLGGNAVIAGKDDDRHAFSARPIGVLQARELDRKRLEPAERTRRLGELVLACSRRIAMGGRDRRAWLSRPIEEALSSSLTSTPA